MGLATLSAFFRPRSVAIVGEFDRPGDLSVAALRNLLRAEFDGPVLPVCPALGSALGVLCHRSVEELPLVPDLAVLCGPPATLAPTVSALGRRGTRHALVLSGANGPLEAAELRAGLLEAARPRGVRLLGPGSCGVQVPAAHLDASTLVSRASVGAVALVSQSGALAAGMLQWASVRALGFSHVISTGDAADVDLGDLLDALALDPEARAVLLHLRDLRDSRKFLSAARATARIKPVIVLRPGRGAGGTSIVFPDGEVLPGVDGDAVSDAALRRAGTLRVREIDELFDAAETLARGLRLRGERLAIVSNGLGPAEMAVDALRAGGGQAAPLSDGTRAALAALSPGGCAGPVIDLGLDATPARYREAVALLLGDRGIDALLVMHAATLRAPDEECAAAVVEAVRGADRLLCACWLGAGPANPALRHLAEAGIACYQTPEKATRAFLHLVDYQRNQHLLHQTPATRAPDPAASLMRGRAREIVARALEEGRRWLRREEALGLVGCYGIAAQDGPASPDAIALMAGIASDPVFGRVLHLGPGGLQERIEAGAALSLPPLNMALAEELASRSGIAGMLAQNFNRAGLDEACLPPFLLRLSELAVDLPEVALLQINPLRADRQGLRAQDVRVAIAPVPPGGHALAIRPYPGELEEEVPLKDGSRVLVRPVRPEDDAAYLEMLRRLSPADRQSRFCSTGPVSREQAMRLTHIDYDREMTLVAMRGPEMVGAVEVISTPGGREAEYSIVVRTDQQGSGLGRALMEKMIRYCRQRRLASVFGLVLKTNAAMLTLDARLGFQAEEEEEDPDPFLETMVLRLE